jgi:Uma2 family endonuclease
LFSALRKNSRKCSCKVVYESDWIIGSDTVVRQDISIVCGPVDLIGHIKIPPVLVVEVISSATSLKDRNTKFKLYEEWGVKFYLMADPDLKKLEIFELRDNFYKEVPDKTGFQLNAGCSISIDTSEFFAGV